MRVAGQVSGQATTRIGPFAVTAAAQYVLADFVSYCTRVANAVLTDVARQAREGHCRIWKAVSDSRLSSTTVRRSFFHLHALHGLSSNGRLSSDSRLSSTTAKLSFFFLHAPHGLSSNGKLTSTTVIVPLHGGTASEIGKGDGLFKRES